MSDHLTTAPAPSDTRHVFAVLVSGETLAEGIGRRGVFFAPEGTTGPSALILGVLANTTNCVLVELHGTAVRRGTCPS